MFRSLKSPTLAMLAFVATSGLAMADVPAERFEAGSVNVAYGDLDLGYAADARVMLNRLEQAAYRACGEDPRWNTSYSLLWPRIKATYQACRSEAVSRAVLAVDAPELTRVYLGKDDSRSVREASNR